MPSIGNPSTIGTGVIALLGSRNSVKLVSGCAAAVWVTALTFAIANSQRALAVPIVLALLGLLLGLVAVMRWHLLRLVWVSATLHGHSLLGPHARQEVDALVRD